MFVGYQDFVELVGQIVLLSGEVSVTIETRSAVEEQIFFAFERGYDSGDFESQHFR